MPNTLITIIVLPCTSLACYYAYIAFKDWWETEEIEGGLIGCFYASIGLFLVVTLVATWRGY